ncbi:MAG: CoA transferase [Pseudomonadales bacterium]|jgi:crotonobetainyl-CoA:carnitine CoA-transferase CaiB-like acyl-CoA transferase|nr:CoA transferase [Pseudomonadales bacterium]MDP6472965.1 CoA transferase [Pseudomonadales bacterium]MDP6826279.1 CoA transferase [Pseudomonadales bacterium]MDP6972545.1 CoA transferase [Pseudomonadales bacterium]|tara:strand:+ start:872 stop:2119 length:1248 start_codon:yes stop_codon:yes gene_type:complete
MSIRRGPLADLTIIDCTMALAGPFGTALLADMGANVIKVEPPSGDSFRPLPPTSPDYANAGRDADTGVDYGAPFATVNRNKRSVVLDFKDTADREKLLELCEQADAIVENMRTGVMDKLGLGYEVVRARNPRIVYGAVRGFGDPRTGESPYAEWPCYDLVAQSMGGVVGLTGPEDDPGYPCGTAVGDVYPGTLMALGVLAAVHHARSSGEGQFMDVAMYDAMLAFAGLAHSGYGHSGSNAKPNGRHQRALMPFGIYPAKDGEVAICAPGPSHWPLLCEAMQRPDLADDERTRNNFIRVKNGTFIIEQVSAWSDTLTKREILELLGGKVPCGPVNTSADVFEDPHVEAREMLMHFKPRGENPEVAIIGSPLKFTKTPTGLYAAPPRLGEHGEEIFEELRINRVGSDLSGFSGEDRS